MTTEILYNMLCSAADAIRDLEIVIMDEVHYLNDAERGHVWEQIMIMLPKHVLLVMLSATVPNTLEFADWLGRIRDSEIHVVATDRRPVPLEHYLFTGLDGQATDQHLHLLVDQNGNFRSSGYNQAIFTYKTSKLKKLPKPPGENSRAEELAAAGRGQAGKGVGSGTGNSGSKPAKAFTGGKFNTPGRWNYMPSSDSISVREKRTKTMWLGVVRMLQEQKLMPAIAFGFSRNSLEVLAGHLSSVDLLTKNEKNQVRQFLRLSIMKRLKGPDAHLPSVLFITDLVRRGLALHHAGMLPLLKETVEMLFQRGLVRLLFATETFAMGVNMPARCVLFSTLEKFDGRRHRPLNPGEYTQMAGRAGRRGLDPSGTVIIMVEGIGRSLVSPVLGVPSEGTLSSIILGTPTRLASQFKITYSMILHLHRTNWLSPQDVMRRSFMEAPALRREIERRQWLARLKARLENTTTLIPSAGASSTSALSWTSKSTSLGSTSVPVGEPVLQVKCPFGQEECAEEMASYYQACCKFRQLSATLSLVLADQPLTDLQRVFCPGRLLFVQLPASDPKCSRVSHSLPNWLVPAMVVDLCKTTVQGQTEVHWNLITWQPSDRLPTRTSHPPYHQVLPVNDVAAAAAENIPDSESSGVCTDLKADVDDEAEEDVLCDGEDCWMKPTPFPPQLMPLFIPESFDDSLARLTLMSDQNSRSLVRLCDNVVQFKSHRFGTNSSITLSEQLTRAIDRHLRELTASAAGLRLIVGANTSEADIELLQLVLPINQALWNLVQPFQSGDPDSFTSSVMYGLLPDCPTPLHLGRATRAKSNQDDSGSSVYDELWSLGDELVNSLIPSSSVPSSHSLAPLTCPDLVSHLARFHRTCRRRWAVKRLDAILSDDKLHLNTGYVG
ncbi:DSHCT domain protein [Paragonimus heterotremus]|uniref:DSHCT domain protein n=1 Tax=Paragonimus heterotremus TaxID=100268 RepID=A0A8J4SGK7_9TREM|nr:DSHCT domain protein [Paragonimus heterotremus]